MKHETKIPKDDSFKPILFEILIETKEDLIELWHRFNMAGELSDYRKDSQDIPSFVGSNCFDIWDTLNDICKARGLYND